MSWNVSFVAKDPQVAAAAIENPTGVAQYAPAEVRAAIAAVVRSIPEQAGAALVVTTEGHLDAHFGGRATFEVRRVANVVG